MPPSVPSEQQHRSTGRPSDAIASILVIEDEPPQQLLLVSGFGARGYHVEVAGTGAAGLDRAVIMRPNLIILDLGLPDMDGLEVCRHLILRAVCPVIVVTADSVEDRMVQALDMGAEDYVLKPFSLQVLDARVRRALRSPRSAAAPDEERIIVCGDLRLDVAAHEARIGDELLQLQPLQFAVLTLLARNEGRVLTYQELSRAVYDDDVSGRTGAERLRTCIVKIRRQLGTGPGRPVIGTEARIGYRLTAPN